MRSKLKKILDRDPKNYEYISVPIRVFIALLFMFSVIDRPNFPQASVCLSIITAWLISRKVKDGNLKKPYTKTIIIYIVAILLMTFRKNEIPPYFIGSLLLSEIVITSP